MSSVYDTLCLWARKTTTSFAELRLLMEHSERADEPVDGLIYRLRVWPDLPQSSKTAGIFRALSVMSNRPVNRRWFVENSRLPTALADRLLQRLVDEGSIEVIDPAKFHPSGH